MNTTSLDVFMVYMLLIYRLQIVMMEHEHVYLKFKISRRGLTFENNKPPIERSVVELSEGSVERMETVFVLKYYANHFIYSNMQLCKIARRRYGLHLF